MVRYHHIKFISEKCEILLLGLSNKYQDVILSYNPYRQNANNQFA